MPASEISHLLNTTRYPLTQPGSAEWSRTVSQARAGLRDVGCCVLADFVAPALIPTLREQGAAIAPAAHYEVKTVNAYNIALDSPLPADHPGRIRMQRGNAFVPRDQIPRAAVIERLYTNSMFQQFVANCFELPGVHELADPLAGLVLNVVRPGQSHPWHFDTNEFTVSLLTQQSEDGGDFEYCPDIRAAGRENFDDVRAVLSGAGEHLIHRLTLRPGDLQLFRGRYSLHRVAPVLGAVARHTAILAYTDRPGVVGSVERTRQLFGRALPEHRSAAASRRNDKLLD
ncbi:MAG: arpA protein [Pseudonocardia sp.]|nr:arpA protein [Pseudonocardia sp.]